MLEIPAFNLVAFITKPALAYIGVTRIISPCMLLCFRFTGIPFALLHCLILSPFLSSHPFHSLFQAHATDCNLMLELPAFNRISLSMRLALASLLLNHLARSRCVRFTDFPTTLFHCLILSLSFFLLPSLPLSVSGNCSGQWVNAGNSNIQPFYIHHQDTQSRHFHSHASALLL